MKQSAEIQPAAVVESKVEEKKKSSKHHRKGKEEKRSKGKEPMHRRHKKHHHRHRDKKEKSTLETSPVAPPPIASPMEIPAAPLQWSQSISIQITPAELQPSSLNVRGSQSSSLSDSVEIVPQISKPLMLNQFQQSKQPAASSSSVNVVQQEVNPINQAFAECKQGLEQAKAMLQQQPPQYPGFVKSGAVPSEAIQAIDSLMSGLGDKPSVIALQRVKYSTKNAHTIDFEHASHPVNKLIEKLPELTQGRPRIKP